MREEKKKERKKCVGERVKMWEKKERKKCVGERVKMWEKKKRKKERNVLEKE